MGRKPFHSRRGPANKPKTKIQWQWELSRQLMPRRDIFPMQSQRQKRPLILLRPQEIRNSLLSIGNSCNSIAQENLITKSPRVLASHSALDISLGRTRVNTVWTLPAVLARIGLM